MKRQVTEVRRQSCEVGIEQAFRVQKYRCKRRSLIIRFSSGSGLSVTYPPTITHFQFPVSPFCSIPSSSKSSLSRASSSSRIPNSPLDRIGRCHASGRPRPRAKRIDVSGSNIELLARKKIKSDETGDSETEVETPFVTILTYIK